MFRKKNILKNNREDSLYVLRRFLETGMDLTQTSFYEISLDVTLFLEI